MIVFFSMAKAKQTKGAVLGENYTFYFRMLATSFAFFIKLRINILVNTSLSSAAFLGDRLKYPPHVEAAGKFYSRKGPRSGKCI